MLITVEEYQQLVDLAEIRELERKLESPDTQWIPWEEAARRLAADRLTRARKAAGLTQQQLAARLRVPQSQVSRIEKNPDRTTVRTLKRIAAALKVDISVLVK